MIELTVIVIPDLLLVLAFRVHDDFGKHLRQDVFKHFRSELAAGPDVTMFQDIQHVALSEMDVSEGQDTTSARGD